MRLLGGKVSKRTMTTTKLLFHALVAISMTAAMVAFIWPAAASIARLVGASSSVEPHGPVAAAAMHRPTDKSTSRFWNDTRPLYDQIQSLKDRPVITSEEALYDRINECYQLCHALCQAALGEIENLDHDASDLEHLMDDLEKLVDDVFVGSDELINKYEAILQILATPKFATHPGVAAAVKQLRRNLKLFLQSSKGQLNLRDLRKPSAPPTQFSWNETLHDLQEIMNRLHSVGTDRVDFASSECAEDSNTAWMGVNGRFDEFRIALTEFYHSSNQEFDHKFQRLLPYSEWLNRHLAGIKRIHDSVHDMNRRYGAVLHVLESFTDGGPDTASLVVAEFIKLAKNQSVPDWHENKHCFMVGGGSGKNISGEELPSSLFDKAKSIFFRAE
jgi:hypothetical protein